jgi:hypothetical protein
MENKFWTPFTYIAGGKALLIGIAGMLIAALLGYAGAVHFDGVIDIHIGARNSYGFFLAEAVSAWLFVSLIFYLTSLIVSSSHVRLIDMLGTQAFARLPLLLPVIIGSIFPLERITAYTMYRFAHIGKAIQLSQTEIIGMALFFFTMVVAIVWLVAWMYQGYKVSANLKGSKCVISFVVSLIIAELAAVTFIRTILFHL